MRGQGPYEKGAPRSLTVRGHTSASQRFMDSGFHSVPWTEDLALRAARVDRSMRRPRQVAAIRNAIEQDRLPDAGVQALIRAGWTELND